MKDLQSASLPAGAIHRKCGCGNAPSKDSTCEKCGQPRGGAHAVSRPTDQHEQEADRVAEQVTGNNSSTARNAPRIRPLPRHSPEPATRPVSVESVLANGGSFLEPAVRHDMEGRFGHDFSNVRVHADAAAFASARDVAADAYTVGNDIVFGAGRYAPHTAPGQRLLAHELTHVVQSGGARGGALLRQPAEGSAAQATPVKAATTDPCTDPDPQLPNYSAAEEKTRGKLLDDMMRGVTDDERKAWCRKLRRALAAFSTDQLKQMKSAGVRVWRQNEYPPPFSAGYRPKAASRNEMARYQPEVRVIQWGPASGVDELRHELAHAWDHVRTGKVDRLDGVKGKNLKKAVEAKQAFYSESGKKASKDDPSVKDTFDQFMAKPVVDGWSFSNPKTDPNHVTTGVKEFYAEGYSVFHSGNEDAQAFMLCTAPELYLLLEKEALAQKLRVPDRAVLDKNNVANRRKCP